jgi:hypothetical protein
MRGGGFWVVLVVVGKGQRGMRWGGVGIGLWGGETRRFFFRLLGGGGYNFENLVDTESR